MPILFFVSSSGASVTRERRRVRSEPQPFDPRHPARLSPDHRRALAVVHEAFANRLTMVLATRLRTVARVTVTSTEQLTYGDFMAGTPDPACLAVISLLPLPGTGVLRLDVPLAMAAVDRLLGGTGEGPHPERALSDIESNLLRSLLDSTVGELAAAFAPLMSMEPAIVRQESKPQLVRGAAPGSTMIVVDFEVLLGDEVGVATLCLPLATVGPALESFAGTGASPLGANTETASLVAANLMAATVEVSVRFNEIKLTSHEILGLEVGDVVPLRHLASSPLAVTVDDTTCQVGVPGRRGTRLACLIVDHQEAEETPPWPS
ncbi:MAG: flagellar motor switch protein FliM [Acidimicrobiaceae bacterium]|nr:flagellar motor switch protein FliM [Acidimicrobiaceae bacterium]